MTVVSTTLFNIGDYVEVSYMIPSKITRDMINITGSLAIVLGYERENYEVWLVSEMHKRKVHREKIKFLAR